MNRMSRSRGQTFLDASARAGCERRATYPYIIRYRTSHRGGGGGAGVGAGGARGGGATGGRGGGGAGRAGGRMTGPRPRAPERAA